MATAIMHPEIAARWVHKQLTGFEALPPEEAHLTYFKALITCARGDGELSARERDWIVGYCAALGGSDAALDYLMTYDGAEDIAEVVTSSAVVDQAGRRHLLYDAIKASAADNHYHDAEQAVVHKMAAALGVPEEVVAQIEDQIEEETRVRAKRLALLFPGGVPFTQN